DRMAKLIPVVRGKPTKLAVMISEQTPAPEFKEKYDKEPQVRHWVDMALRIEGTNKTFGVHAAGVVISSEPLDEIVPLQKNNDGSVITQYFMEDMESLGLLKMDFLGLRNLTLIQKTVDLIKQYQNIDLDPDQLPLEERRVQKILAKGEVKKMPQAVKSTYKVLEEGELEGIFQLESSGMRQIVRDLKPSCIEDISSILALYRPGPLDAGLIPKFINRKHGKEEIIYPHPLSEPILNETYGVLVYQEQIMKMAQDLAGYSLGQADLLRRSMGKKKVSEMQKHRETFVDGAAKNGVKKHVAEALFEQMVNFAEYCFNKSHSTAYGYVTYQTAYLKANYPVEYMAALLTAHSDDQDKVQRYISRCLSMNIQIEPPDINRSGVDFTPSEGKILFGLSAVRNVGQGAIACILSARNQGGPFKSLADLCERVDLRAVNRRAFEALIHCGAFDTLEPNRNQLLHDLPLVLDWAQSRAKDRESGQGSLFDLLSSLPASDAASPAFESAPRASRVPDFPQPEKLRLEKELLGFYVSDHPLKSVRKSAQVLAPIDLSQLSDQREKAMVSVVVMLSSIKPLVTKKGDRMAIVQIEDLTGQAEAVVFPRAYERLHPLLTADARLFIWGKVERKEEQTQLIVEDIEPIEAVRLVMVELTPQQASNIQAQDLLKTILQEHSGDKEKNKVPVLARVAAANDLQIVRFGRQFWVQNHQATVEALKSARFLADAQSLTNHF
ncbi:MAG: DNA polymerase III subunit alpha, partial [Chroococcidiopsidaceae cyanobacterium CP_BM_RX_35]|nr:DNA polymerase III subunit alpha [Chroococcidiopsidaceae cyanobacterium CP_BM_RX_35]